MTPRQSRAKADALVEPVKVDPFEGREVLGTAIKITKLERRTPLRTRTRLETRTPLKAKARAGTGTTRRYKGFDEQTRTWIKDRDGWVCVARVSPDCTGRPDRCHHVWLASAGGPDESWNGITVCVPCHDWIHAHPTTAEARGLYRHR